MKQIYVHFPDGRIGADIYVNPSQEELKYIESSGIYFINPKVDGLLKQGISPSFWEIRDGKIEFVSKEKWDEIIANAEKARPLSLFNFKEVLNDEIEKRLNIKIDKSKNDYNEIINKINLIKEKIDNFNNISKDLNNKLDKQRDNLYQIESDLWIEVKNNKYLLDELKNELNINDERHMSFVDEVNNEFESLNQKFNIFEKKLNEIDNKLTEIVNRKIETNNIEKIYYKETHSHSKWEKYLPYIIIALAFGTSVIINLI